MEIKRIGDPERWNAFVSRHEGPVFDRWEWGQMCSAYGHDVIYLGVFDDNLCGVLPLVHMESRIFGDKLVSMPYSEYGSVVVANDAPDETDTRLVEETRAIAEKRGVDFVSLRGRAIDAPQDFTHKRRFVTFEIPLEGGPEEAWDALDSSRRNHIRTARENDLVVRNVESTDDLRRFYDLYLDNMRSFGTPPHSFEFFQRLRTELNDVTHFDLAFSDDVLVNAKIVFHFGDYSYDWTSISNHEYRDIQGGSLLLWNAIERACEDGYSRYSLGRTREGTGVYMFKKSWGGEKVWFDDYHYFPDGTVDLPDADDETYKHVKNAWQKLPLRATSLIGPHIRKSVSL